MADAYQIKFDEATKLIPPAKAIIQRPSPTTEIWAEVRSGTPEIIKPPKPSATDKDFATKDAARTAVLDRMQGIGVAMQTTAAFKELTGFEHETLLRHWATHDIGSLTSCNSFVGKIAGKFGQGWVGDFHLEQKCAKFGRAECWVPVSSGERPRYGDVYESMSHNVGFDNIHIGFSLDFDGDTWNTLEGGQGGPILGYDRVCRLKKKFDTTHILGWVDMRKLCGFEKPLPAWLLGTWIISSKGQVFVYQIDRLGTVTELASAPTTPDQPMRVVDTAKVEWATDDQVKLNWKGEQGIETLFYDRPGSAGFVKRLTGKAGDGGDFSGIKLFN